MAKKKATGTNIVKEIDVRLKESDIIMYRVLLVLIYTIALVWLLLFVHGKSNTIEVPIMIGYAPVFWAVGAVLIIAAGSYRIYCICTKKDERLKIVSSSLLLYAAGVLAGVCFLYKLLCLYNMSLLIIAVIAAAVCYFVYYMYPTSLFTYTLFATIGVTALFLITEYAHATHILADIARAGVGVYAIILAVISILAQRSGGKLKIGSRIIKLGDEKYTATFTLVTAALLLITSVLAFIAPFALTYMVYIYGGAFIVLIIIGTVMML
ncbi:MAG: hypothetical protein WAO54_08965 [Eubacteriales bacterium]|jgi:hypothetical protein|nr:hypothetical protein [Clostridiales bacterium]